MTETGDDRWAETLDRAVVNLALFGYLNPRIFVPNWFENRGLLTADDVKSAEVSPDSPALIAFATDWFTLEVSLDRYLIYGSAAHRERLITLTERTFEILEHTPLVGVGVGYEFDIPFGSSAARDQAFDAYAPLSVWSDIFSSPAERRLQLVVPTNDSIDSRVRVVIEDSTSVENALWAMVAIEDLPREEDRVSEGCALSMAALRNLWAVADGTAERVLRPLLRGEP